MDTMPLEGEPTSVRSSSPLVKSLAFFAGTTLALAAIVYVSNSPLSFTVLPMGSAADRMHLIYQEAGVNTAYAAIGNQFQKETFGTAHPTTFIAKRGGHIASIQSESGFEYAVRLNDREVYVSSTLKTGASPSPDGAYVAFAETAQNEIAPGTPPDEAQEWHVAFVDSATGSYTDVGRGFSPFYLGDGTLVWFSSNGLMALDSARTMRTLDADVHAQTPPYPAPAISPDGTYIAWATPATQSVEVRRVTVNGTEEVAQYTNAKSPYLSLSNDALYTIEYINGQALVWRHALTDDATPERINGLPTDGMLIQLVP